MLSYETGVQLLPVPYKGSSQAIVALLGDEINVAIDSVAAAASHIRAGKLKPLALLGEQRSSVLPDVPTVAELKLPHSTFDAWYGLAAPAGTPQPVLQKLVTEINAVMASPDIKAKFKANAMEPVSIGPEQFKAKIESEISAYTAVSKRAKITMD
jgi:tripartite-type tricarboxylate transporter receptor subunit TctC